MSSGPTTRPAFFSCLPSQLFMYVIVRWPSPSPGPSSHRHPFTWPWSWNPGPTLPTWKVHRQHGAGGGRKNKSEEEAFLSLQSFLRLATGERKKGSLHHLHNSWNIQEKNRPLSGKEKSLDGVIVVGRRAAICMPAFVPSDLSFLLLFIHQCSPHTQSLSHVCH